MLLDNDGSVPGKAPAPEPLTEAEAAARLGLKIPTLRAWRHRGVGPTFVRLGRAIRYLPSDIEQYLSENRHAPGSKPQE